MEKTLPCPECDKFFSSKISLQNHYRNLHDPIHHGEVLESVLVHEQVHFPERAENVVRILNNVRQKVFANQRERLTRAKHRIAVTNVIDAAVERARPNHPKKPTP